MSGIEDSNEYIKITELKELLGISRPTLMNVIEKDDFPKCKSISERVKVWKRAEVIKWMGITD